MKPGSGRKHALSGEAASMALDMLIDDKYGTATQVAQELQLQGHTTKRVHRSTVVRAARRVAGVSGKRLKALKGKPTKRLTAATKAKRLAFAHGNMGRCWGNVMFTVRKKFLFRYPGAIVKAVKWVLEGEEHQAVAVNHPQCVNVYAGITKHGVTVMHIVAGTSKHKTTFKNKEGDTASNITAAEYQHVMTVTLLPEGKRVFSTQGISSWVFQQDNDPAHKRAAEHVQQWNTQHSSSISLLPSWPPNSPDLNPIENVWGYVQARVDALGCKTFEEFKQAVFDEFKAVPHSMLKALCDSMPKRLAQVLELQGDKTKY